jgi:hypothetical protein
VKLSAVCVITVTTESARAGADSIAAPTAPKPPDAVCTHARPAPAAYAGHARPEARPATPAPRRDRQARSGTSSARRPAHRTAERSKRSTSLASITNRIPSASRNATQPNSAAVARLPAAMARRLSGAVRCRRRLPRGVVRWRHVAEAGGASAAFATPRSRPCRCSVLSRPAARGWPAASPASAARRCYQRAERAIAEVAPGSAGPTALGPPRARPGE